MRSQLHAIFKGKVQGVGFRWTIVNCAQRYFLTGTTKNLTDGSVEVYAQGERESLESFLASIQNDSGLARIESVKAEYQKPITQFNDFKIIYEQRG